MVVERSGLPDHEVVLVGVQFENLHASLYVMGGGFSDVTELVIEVND